MSVHGGIAPQAKTLAARPRSVFETEVAPAAVWPPSEAAADADGEAEGSKPPPPAESRARTLARRRAALGDERLPCIRGKSPCVIPTTLRHRFATNLAGSFGCSALAFSPDGTLLVGACLARGGPGDDRYPIYVWGVVEGSLRCVLSGHTGIVHSLAWTSAGELLSCSADTTLRVWTLSAPPSGAGGIAAAKDAAEIPVGAAGSEATGLKPIVGLQRLALTHPCFVYGCAVHPRSKPERPIIVSCGYERNLWLWDGASGEAIAEALPQKPEKCVSLCLSRSLSSSCFLPLSPHAVRGSRVAPFPRSLLASLPPSIHPCRSLTQVRAQLARQLRCVHRPAPNVQRRRRRRSAHLADEGRRR